MPKKIPFVSVLVVNYNGKDFIGQCLNSVLKSDYPRFEVVLVDNGSTDKSVDYITKQYKKELRSKKICLIKSKKNLYFTGGSNLAAKHAKGEKLIFFNSDTVVTPNWIKELITCSKSGEKYLIQPKILFYSKKNIIDNAGGRYLFPGFGFGIGRGEKDSGQYDQIKEIDFANGTCFMIDKNFFWQLGGFDEDYHFFYEDVDLSLRAKKIGGKCFICPQSIIYHRRGATLDKTLSAKQRSFYARRNRRQTVLKNFVGLGKRLRLFFLEFYL
jgi:GT2 family glycosyltransferase